MRQIYLINENGYIEDIQVSEIAEPSECIVVVDPPQGLYHAKWDGAGWVEDMTQEEIDALNNQPRPEMPEEKIAKLETKLELIQVALDDLILNGGA